MGLRFSTGFKLRVFRGATRLQRGYASPEGLRNSSGVTRLQRGYATRVGLNASPEGLGVSRGIRGLQSRYRYASREGLCISRGVFYFYNIAHVVKTENSCEFVDFYYYNSDCIPIG